MEIEPSRDNNISIVASPLVPNLFDDILEKLSKRHSKSPFMKVTS